MFAMLTHASRNIRVRTGALFLQHRQRCNRRRFTESRYVFYKYNLQWAAYFTKMLTVTAGNEPSAISTEEKPRHVGSVQVKEEAGESISDDDGTEKLEDVTKVRLVPESFSPLYFMFQWVEPLSTRQHLSLVINMPSGTLTTYGICVVGGGYVLQCHVAFTKFVVDIERLPEYWLKRPGSCISEDHTKIGASVQALKARETGSARRLLCSSYSSSAQSGNRCGKRRPWRRVSGGRGCGDYQCTVCRVEGCYWCLQRDSFPWDFQMRAHWRAYTP